MLQVPGREFAAFILPVTLREIFIYPYPVAGAREGDGGLYTCQVKSPAGQTAASAWVRVLPQGEGVAAPPPDLLDFPASPGQSNCILR